MRGRPEKADEVDHQIDEIVEAEAAVPHRHVARVDPVGQVDVVVRQGRGDGAAQQSREMTRKRRHHQQLRLVERGVLAEMNEAAERVTGDGLLDHRDIGAVDRHPIDAEWRPLMRHPGL